MTGMLDALDPLGVLDPSRPTEVLERELLDTIAALPADLKDAGAMAIAQGMAAVQNVRATTPWSDENRTSAQAVMSQTMAKLHDLLKQRGQA